MIVKSEIRRSLRFLMALVLGLSLFSCVEEFNAQTESFEDLLVVDGLLTDKLRHQEVQLTRVFPFEEEVPRAVTNATVVVIDGEGAQFNFNETEPGVYLSENEFAAQTGSSYTLRIETPDGKNYSSQSVSTPVNVPIADLQARRMTNDLGEEGVGILLDNISDGSEPKFFRFEFEETYKVIAPRWDPFRLRVVRYEPCFPNPFEVDIVTWEDERKTCFGSSNSSRLIQTSSIDLTENQIDDFQVQFLSRENYIISHRYSINVTQYTQTQDAHSFYERLGDFSSSENIFSQVQPGFLEGNINNDSNQDENVLGYFEVASVSERRLYFNYADLFPDEPLPPYAINCETFGNPRLWPQGYHCADVGVCDGNCISPLIEAILAGLVTFAAEKEDDFISPYYTWPSPCGDCTKLGSNVAPEFWTEE